MDRVVVVDGFSSGKHLARRLRENACALMHVASSAELDSYYYTGFDDAIYDRLVVSRDIDATVSAVENFAPQCVVAGAESGVLLADLLNERLNLPYCNRFDRTDSMCRPGRAICGATVCSGVVGRGWRLDRAAWEISRRAQAT